MIEKVILTVVAVLMLVLTLRKKDKYSISLTLGLTFGIILTLVENSVSITIGYVIYIIASLFSAVYGIRNKELNRLERTVIVLTGIWSVCVYVSSVLHLPFATLSRLSVVIPIILYILSVIKGISKTKEFGFLTILNVNFLFRFLRLWN